MSKYKAIALGAVILWPSISLGATSAHIGTINRLLNDTERFGHCMIYTTVTTDLDCPDRWFSLDCKGSFNSKETTRRLWDAAQLAYATESRLYIVVNDQKKHNGYCVIDRLDVRND